MIRQFLDDPQQFLDYHYFVNEFHEKNYTLWSEEYLDYCRDCKNFHYRYVDVQRECHLVEWVAGLVSGDLIDTVSHIVLQDSRMVLRNLR